jgi:hypothetical protein
MTRRAWEIIKGDALELRLASLLILSLASAAPPTTTTTSSPTRNPHAPLMSAFAIPRRIVGKCLRPDGSPVALRDADKHEPLLKSSTVLKYQYRATRDAPPPPRAPRTPGHERSPAFTMADK